MNNLNVIDQFMQTFITYIDSGFGLLQGDVAGLSSILIGIDITVAALFWALDGEANVLARLIKKVLYVGAFAYIINNFHVLATLIFNSFSQLGLTAAGSGMTAADLLRPGKLAGTGFHGCLSLGAAGGQAVGLYNGVHAPGHDLGAGWRVVHRCPFVFHFGCPAFHHDIGIQAHHVGGFRAGPICALGQDRLPG